MKFFMDKLWVGKNFFTKRYLLAYNGSSISWVNSHRKDSCKISNSDGWNQNHLKNYLIQVFLFEPKIPNFRIIAHQT
jgi:hypothetical protein